MCSGSKYTLPRPFCWYMTSRSKSVTRFPTTILPATSEYTCNERVGSPMHDRAKRRVQVGETPTATHAQVQIGVGIHGPKHRVARCVDEIVPSTPGGHGWDLISQEFLLQVGA